MQIDEGQLGVFLIDSGLMTRGQWEEMRRLAEGESLYTYLYERNVIPEDELRRAAAHASGTTFVLLTPGDISAMALVLIPEPISRLHNLVAYKLEDNVLDVAALDLDDLAELKPLNLNYKIRPRLTSRNSIKQGLIYYQKILKEKFGSLLQQGTHVVDALIHHALLSRAHGVHIDLNTTSALVRYRINTSLREAMQLPQHIGAALAERLKTLAKLLPTSSSLQEGRFKFEKDGEMHTVHVSSLPTAKGERVMLRLAKDSAGASGFALSALGLHGENLEQVHALLTKNSGLVIVAGLGGGGKTTTLYTMIDQLNHHDISIATIEERVEHHFPHVAQTKTRPDVGLTTVAGLRAILKQDPDVVVVGEIKDADTAALAASAANKGILVLAGLEANSAGEAIEKLKNFGVSPRLLTAVLKGVVAVQTVKKLCQNEHDTYKLSRAEGAPLEHSSTSGGAGANFGRVLSALKEEDIVGSDMQWKDLLFARATPCSKCEGGYTGTTGLQEVLTISSAIKDMILSDASGEEIEAQAREEGMVSIIEDGLFKAVQGRTSIEEVFRVA